MLVFFQNKRKTTDENKKLNNIPGRLFYRNLN